MMITIVLDYYSVGGWMRMDREMKERDEFQYIDTYTIYKVPN